MPAALTTVPAVLTALVQLAQTVVPSMVDVYDGAPNTDAPADEYLAVGFSRDEDDASVDGDFTDQGNRTADETYLVRCLLSVATGDTEGTAVADRRARAAYLFGLFATAVRADPQLGGALTAGGTATVSAYSWIYGPAAQGGAYAEVEFDISVSAFYLGAT